MVSTFCPKLICIRVVYIIYIAQDLLRIPDSRCRLHLAPCTFRLLIASSHIKSIFIATTYIHRYYIELYSSFGLPVSAHRGSGLGTAVVRVKRDPPSPRAKWLLIVGEEQASYSWPRSSGACLGLPEWSASLKWRMNGESIALVDRSDGQVDEEKRVSNGQQANGREGHTGECLLRNGVVGARRES